MIKTMKELVCWLDGALFGPVCWICQQRIHNDQLRVQSMGDLAHRFCAPANLEVTCE